MLQVPNGTNSPHFGPAATSIDCFMAPPSMVSAKSVLKK